VNTDLRNDLRSRRPSFPPESGRHQIGRVAAISLEYLAALDWNP
jgi:hypothetical protein